MADQRVRELARRARAGDQEAGRALSVEAVRLGGWGGRDPRVDPMPGDVLRGGRQRTTRTVVHVEERGPCGRPRVFYLVHRRHPGSTTLDAGVGWSVLLKGWQAWAAGAEVLHISQGEGVCVVRRARAIRQARREPASMGL